MSGNKCSYLNCGKSKRNYPNLQFHHFPADVAYSRIWILNSGNINLENLSLKVLRSRIICSDHFIDSMYMNAERRKLIRRAVPIKYTAHNIEQFNEAQIAKIHRTPVKNCNTSSQLRGTILNFKTENTELDLTSPESLMLKPTLSVTPNYIFELSKLPTPLNNVSLSLQLQNEQLENRCKKLENLINKKSETICFLKKQYLKLLDNKKKKLNTKNFIKSVKFQSKSSKSLVSMQINHKLRKPWNSEEKKLSLCLYIKSPSTYKYMRQNKIKLPGESTIRRWL